MWKKLTASALMLSLAAASIAHVENTSAAAIDSNEVTRGEYVKKVIETMGLELGTGKIVKFEDVPDSLKPYIEKAIELKLVSGKTETQFAPDDKITREEAIVIVANALQKDSDYSEAVLNKFKDSKEIQKDNRDEVAKAVSLGILKGYGDQTLKPTNVLSYRHMNTILERFLKEYSPVEANTTVSLRILGTSDIHTNIMNYDYYKDTESNSLGLVKTATLIKKAREENQNTLLFDNGDSIQGTPLGSYKQAVAVLKDGEEHPSITAMELLDYDGSTFGNHEFNYGLDYLDEVLDDADFPYVNANIKDATTGENLYTPYVLIDKEVVDSQGNKTTIKVGVTGIVPPQILNWDKSHLEGKIVVDDSVQAVEKVVPVMEKEGADVIVVLSHSGLGDTTHEVGEEDVTYLLTKVEGVDAIITGHAHQVFPGQVDESLTGVDLEQGTINGVPVVMPGKYGSHLGVIDLTLEQKGEEWEVVNSKAEVRKIAEDASDVDKEVAAVVKEAHEGTIEYVRQAVGNTTADIHSYFSQVQDDPSIQIVTNAQTEYVKEKIKGTQFENLPVLSAGAPFKAGTRSDPDYYTFVPKGELAIKNVADLYLYDNTVAIIKVTGADVKEWLEMSAGQFNQIDPSKTEEQQLINTEFRSYNYDVIDGVTYEIDVTQPAKYDANGKLVNEKAERIVNLQYDGKPIDLTQEFIVATNNYRANGTFPGVRNASYVEIYPDENRQAIIDYIIANKTIDPTADGNWKFSELPKEANIVFETSKKAVDVIPQNSNIQYIGEGTDGFGKYSIK
ncbi:bifunctional 2',3'-cyclic-nucleotide 2'-phosphodiesterase/3'-nucleotidase [Ureibacillus endophyticus]|uniref:Bifunctional 2',3'-cyclic-nucleotide 2'-phosphodiesterase/3'-nucleotidase n=1 Tax=Ureibacillus endophyticus TaxID=1978490 RepID=A0A494ZB69_9BACL|nr:bifunctional 2',3'-cyclic-nucleotide 2'-phosphodiesterase/3'-nucleotidase [Lysinibacillus endophyticus]RKQ19342.1 bifunctional 2',3'-cyclic-nucleotide 2'-phosphodiesterase/3'-nucleotidase [Lysinibacillus endophyticus]